MHTNLPVPPSYMTLEVVTPVEAPLWLRTEGTKDTLVPMDARNVAVQSVQSLEALSAIIFGAQIDWGHL